MITDNGFSAQYLTQGTSEYTLNANSTKGLSMKNEQVTPLQFKVVRNLVTDDAPPSEPRVRIFKVCVSYAILGALAITLAYLSGVLTVLADKTEIGQTLGIGAYTLGGFACMTVAGICVLAYNLDTK